MYKFMNKQYMVNVFDNLDDLYKFCKNTPRRQSARNSSDDGDYNFSGTHNLQEAYDLLKHGDEELYKEIVAEKNKIDIQKILGNVINRNTLKNDVVGFAPDVPAFLKGIPYNMINTEPRKMSQKVLNIAVDICVSAFVNKSQMKQAGILYLSIIDILEKAGYRCNLYVLDSSKCDGKEFYCATRIKTDREPLNIKKMAFCLAHSSFFRRILFKWEESCDFSTLGIEPTNWGNGYGQPNENTKRIKSVLKKHIKSDFLLWKLQMDFKLDIKDIIKRLEDDGIKLRKD